MERAKPTTHNLSLATNNCHPVGTRLENKEFAVKRISSLQDDSEDYEEDGEDGSNAIS